MFKFLIVILLYYAVYKLVRILSYNIISPRPDTKHFTFIGVSCEIHRVTVTFFFVVYFLSLVLVASQFCPK